MKKTLLFLAAIAGVSILNISQLIAQSPQFLNYQAIVREDDGTLIIDTEVLIEMYILQGSTTGAIVYSESHTVTTNDYGLISLLIGNGTTSDDLSSIDWANGPFFLKTDVDGQELSVAQLLSVPYALYSDEAGNGVTVTQTGNWDDAYSWGNHASAGYSPLTNDFIRDNDTIYYIDGNVGIGTKDPRSTLSVHGSTVNDTAIFEVKNNAGYTVFAVYNEGVRIYIDEEYSGKGPKGGFAIGGFDRNKGPVQEYLRVTSDSTRIYVDQNASKGPKGGFSIGGFDGLKGETIDYLNLTPENYFIGHESGTSVTTGEFNSFFGYNSGMDNTTGSHNIFMGYQSGMKNVKGGYNVILGSGAGYHNNGNYNVFIGYQSGYNNVSGTDARYSKWNTFIGYQSGYGNTTGWHNLIIGYQAGLNNHTATNQLFIGNNAGENLTDGYGNSFVGHYTGNMATDCDKNTILGYFAGVDNLEGDNNVYFGYVAGMKALGSNNVLIGENAASKLVNGDENVIIGKAAGFNNTSGSGNIFIGNKAGYNVTGSEKLFIDNSITTNPLIYGDFAENYVVINGMTRHSSTLEFYVNGQGGGIDSWYTGSDERMKKNITTIPSALNKVQQLRGVNFEWKDTETGGGGIKMGFIAQEAIDIIPEVVNPGDEYYSMQYAPITALLVEAVKEQQEQIEQLKNGNAEISSLQQQNIDLQNEIDELRAMITNLQNLFNTLSSIKE